jgi:hypothetical protein
MVIIGMHTLFCLLLTTVGSVLSATNTSLEIDLIGMTPNGDLVAWHEKGINEAGELERYVVAKTIDLSPTQVFTISDPLTATVETDKGKLVRTAKQKIRSLGIKSGRGTQEINDIYGNYRQLAYTARLYLKASPSRLEYNLEVYDELTGRTRIVTTDKIATNDPDITSSFLIKQARLSRDRSTCTVVVQQSYLLNGKYTIDKIYTFMVFAAPPPEIPPPGGPPPSGIR